VVEDESDGAQKAPDDRKNAGTECVYRRKIGKEGWVRAGLRCEVHMRANSGCGYSMNIE